MRATFKQFLIIFIAISSVITLLLYTLLQAYHNLLISQLKSNTFFHTPASTRALLNNLTSFIFYPHQNALNSDIITKAYSFLIIYALITIIITVAISYLLKIIIEKRRLYKNLAERKERLKDITTSLSEGIYVTNTQGIITFCNPKALALLGYTEAELVDSHAHSLFHYTNTHDHLTYSNWRHIEKVIQTKKPYYSEQEIFWNKEGKAIPISLSVSPIMKNAIVIGSVSSFQDITERKFHEAEIKKLAFYDPLTNLPNRRLFFEKFELALNNLKYDNRIIASMMLDLDNFKHVNDSYGHDIGDEVLKIVASRLDSCVRGDDIVSRHGGDEFAIILVRIAQEEDAAVVAEYILHTMQKPFIVKQHVITLTASIGINIYGKHNGKNIKQVLKQADLAMYSAKKAGGNNYYFYTKNTNITENAE